MKNNSLTSDGDLESEEQRCMVCNGSGEGMHDGTRCYSCNGSGVEKVSDGSEDDDYYYEMRRDRRMEN